MFWTNRRTLITGASGYLGGELCRALKRRGAVVVALDSRPGGASGADDQLVADLCNLGETVQALKTHAPATIFHLAGQSGVASSHRDPVQAFTANGQATWTLLEACRTIGSASEIVVTSSNHVYGHQQSLPTVETAPLNGTEAYAASKVCTDVISRCFASSYNLPIVIARITNSFGGNDPHLDHLIAGAIGAVLRGEAPEIRGNGTARKAYLYVDDTIEALIALAENLSSARLAGEAFNVVGAQPTSVLETVRAILEEMNCGLEPKVLGTDAEPEEFEHLSGEKISERLGWQPRYSFREGLRKAVEDYRALLSTTPRPRGGHR